MIKLITRCILLLPALFQAQITIQPEAISIKDGFFQGIISLFYQVKKRFRWIGSKNGLIRYDGVQFNISTSDPADSHSNSFD